ncbi:dethiobiotin synthetase [Methylohalomonas lacus]|uniref:ATP-dependent dethiobiotin synthetase BioD n=1 Tax=Methylohalomonas lacus TaxID=398773 RepID=A0AAE3HJ43_9GAMM|nr:dethiobiotin synthase [Methylohalomonas lacus]MCS3903321.1 dethiobiotin synthetase [Methylohalomonas lacus]
MSAAGVFVTGTDTGIGKTWVSVGLLDAWRTRGLNVAGMKPVASGSELIQGELRNEDALALQAAASRDWPYATINPYAFAPPIAPHVAAEQAGVTVALEPLTAAYAELAAASDRVVVEGVGGWRVPLSVTLQTADLVRALDLPVVLVVGLRLGCINHALLTAEAIRADGLALRGWIANTLDPDYEAEATLATLAAAIPAPLLARVPYAATADARCWQSLAEARVFD